MEISSETCDGKKQGGELYGGASFSTGSRLHIPTHTTKEDSAYETKYTTIPLMWQTRSF